ncbi:hypothetical protein LCGC14_0263950 [marine sediment metagenome]|uniref:Peptidase S74 domain-containing protein n=1 Tax=marine sediment metagenome TaxID=412755 RepID=A0A0F9WLD6_9ZZZZ
MGRLAVETFRLGDDQSSFFGDAGDATFTYDGTNLVINPQAVGSGNTKISDGILFLNEDTNTMMSIGITINQGANDDHILTFKSSDVSHPMTAVAEDDTFGYILKAEGTSGGLTIAGFKDADGVAGFALNFIGRLGEAADTNQTTAGIGVVHIQSAITDGSTGIAAVAAGGNAFVVANLGVAEFIVDGAGNLYANAGTTTAAVTVYDEADDLQMVRAVDIARSNAGVKGLIRSEFDDYLKYNEEDLVDAGILGAPLAEGGLINVTGLQQLHNGALNQLYGRFRESEKRALASEERVRLLESRMKMLTEGD